MLMPFRDDLTEMYKKYIKEPLKNMGYSVKRADDFYRSTEILVDILRSIETSDIVIADLTSENANVFYELGYAHHVQMEKVILISQESQNPFDVGSKRIIFYTPDTEGCIKLQEELIKFVKTVEKEFSKTSKKKIPNTKRSDREIVDLIKSNEFENESDFVIETNGYRLFRFINLIIGELISIKWEPLEKRIRMERLLDFIQHILELKKDPSFINNYIRTLIANLPIILNKTLGDVYYNYIVYYLRIPHILQYVKTNQEIISTLVNTFCNSHSFNETRIGIDVLRLISDTLNKKLWSKIIKASLENDQIYNAGRIFNQLSALIKKSKIKLKSATISKIKEVAELLNSNELLEFYNSLKQL